MAEFKNPNQQGGQDNNSLLMMMLVMMVVIFGVQYYHMKHAAPTASPSAPAVAGSQSAPAAAAPAASTPAPATAAAATPAKASAPAKGTTAPTVAVVQGAAETMTVVENELYRIEFSNRGGEVRSWILKGQTDNEGQPLDMVHEGAAEKFGYPLSLYMADATLSTKLRQALYVASAQGTMQAPGTLSFSYSDGAMKVTKTFTFDQTYVIHADVQISQNGAPVQAALSWPGGLGDAETVGAYTDGHLETMSNGNIDHVDPKKVTGGATIGGPLDLGGVSDTYFTAIFMPDQPQTATLTTLHNQMEIAKLPNGGAWRGHYNTTPKNSNGTTPVEILGAAIGDPTGHVDTRLFVGPKYKEVLQTIKTSSGHSLEPVLNFGFWGFIGKYLFVSLELIHDHVASNWGWAVILLTLILTLLLVPTRVMSMRSAIKMQRIQPMVNAIKAKYKNPKATDPKAAEMNAEVMALYKEHNVNMFGGCLPGILPMPLIFAFYTMLMHVVELRHAHWYWLHDLTQPDPTHILAIFTVITMFLVQFYTPSPGVDPAQQKMMAFMMPLMSGYFTWSYAAGLALYLTASSLVNIVQQLIMNRTSLGIEMREIAAKRARRKGTTIQGKR